MVSISPDEKTSDATAYAREIKATFPVVQDPKYVVHEKFGVEPVPANVVIGRDGKVVASIEGSDVKALEDAVAKAMKP